MPIELVTIGDELLLGLTIDTNSAFLARELAELGVPLGRRTSVGDSTEEITAALREALDRSGVVLTTGGLGPTADDLTTASVARLFGRELYFDEAQWQRLRAIWRSRGRQGEPPDANRQQVMLPEGCVVLTNRHGSAPGVLVEDERGRWVATLPGVPREMRALWREEVMPIVRQRLGGAGTPIRSITVRTTGIAESALPSRLGDAARGIGRLALAYLPGAEGVDLRLTARDVAEAEIDALLRAGADVLRQRVGLPVYAEGDQDLASVVLEACRAKGTTVAVAESCTGGLLGARLTAIPGSSDVFRGGVIAYANDAKVALLGVGREALASAGAVSEEVALEMARGVRGRFGAAIGVGITGIAGPGGATPGKPVGLVHVAVDFGDHARTFGGQLVGDRAEIRVRATQVALDLIRRELQGSDAQAPLIYR